MSLSGHREEGVAAVHQVAGDELVGVRCAASGRATERGRLEQNHKEDLYGEEGEGAVGREAGRGEKT